MRFLPVQDSLKLSYRCAFLIEVVSSDVVSLSLLPSIPT